MTLADDEKLILELCRVDGYLNTSEIEVNMDAVKHLIDLGLIYPLEVMLTNEGQPLVTDPPTLPDEG